MIFSTTQSVAEIPNKFKVYTAGAGLAGQYCRALVEAYNKKYDSAATISIKPGANGLLVLLEMVNDPNLSFSCMSSLPVLLAIEYPNYIQDLNMIAPLNIFCSAPHIFNTKLSSPYNHLSELMAAKKTITVGQHTMIGQIVAQKMFNLDAITVNFKSATDAIPSLVEGTLDLYIDSGTFSSTGLTKSLGRIGGASTTPGPDLTNTVLSKQIPSPYCVHHIHKKHEAHFGELNARLNIIQKSNVFTSMLLKVHNEPLYFNVLESKNNIDAYSKAILSVTR